MLFNSFPFLIFFIVVVFIYFKLKHPHQNSFLLAAGYVFYGWWDWRFLAVLLFTTLVNFVCSTGMEKTTSSRTRTILLSFAVLLTIGNLALFKYLDFFSESIASLFGIMGLKADIPTLNIIWPIGISFYTFQSLGYTIDVYRRKYGPTRNLSSFALFVAFFPLVLSGPIERGNRLLPQIHEVRQYDLSRILDGVWLFLLGYAQKTVIADRLSDIVALGFSSETPAFGGGQAWIFLLSFSFQIFADLSGYTYMARGIARILGFEVMANFKKPYLVHNPQEFWRHWHISLSSWIRDYLYIPLGGSRKGILSTCLNLLVCMLLCGLWLGARRAFVFWGLYHGILLCTYHFWKQVIRKHIPLRFSRLDRFPAYRGITMLICFMTITIGWLFFRAGTAPADIDQSKLILNYLQLLFQPFSIREALPWARLMILLAGLSMLCQWKYASMEHFHQWPLWVRSLAITSCFVLIMTFGVFDGNQFIYFRF